GPEMRGAKALILIFGQTENLAHPVQIFLFARMKAAIGACNHEQTIEQVFEDAGSRAKQIRGLLRVRFETSDVLLREVEEMPDIRLLFRWNRKHALEHFDF